jgi:hypothetical protein
MLKKTKPLAEIGIFSAIFAVSLLLLHLFIGIPLLQASKKKKEEFKATQAKLKEAEELIRSVPNPQKEIEEIQKKADEFKDMEMNKKQIPRIISMLGDSVPSGMTIVSIKPRDDISTEGENLPAGVSKIYVEMVLYCSYQQFGEYLDTLLRLPMSFTIESITLQRRDSATVPAQAPKKSKGAQGEKKEALTATLILSTYMVWQL